MNVCCVIVTFNISEDILKTYKSIRAQVTNIIFIDNNSNDNTKFIIKDICDKDDGCDFIFNDENEGIAKALNAGIKKSLENYDADFILTLDHDSVASEDMIKNMLSIYKNHNFKDKIAILSPAIYDINKKDYLTHVNNAEFQEIKEPIQSGSLIKREVFENVGLYNESMFIYYVDTEFCYRTYLKGYNIVQCNKAMLYHEEGKKSSHNVLGKIIYYNNYSEFAIYYRARNNIYMIKKYQSIFSSKDRLVKDFIKILFFDNNKIISLSAHFKGIRAGIFKHIN